MEYNKAVFSQSKQISVEYHRAYRKLHYGNLTSGMLSHLGLFLVLAGAVLFWLDKLTFFYASATAVILRNALPSLQLSSIPFLHKSVWLLHGQGLMPSGLLLLCIATASLVGWLLLSAAPRLSLPIALSLKVLCVINLIGCLYFFLWGNRFPYDFNDFSNLYLTAEIGMWIALPLMLIFALLPVPVALWTKALLLLGTVAYTYVFGIFRYAICLYILARFSYIWMALLYFGVVVFFDFACMIAFYSYYISLAAPRMVRKRGIWRWLYSS
jgi:hypothetical protein